MNLSHTHKMRFWYNHLRHFYMGVPPGFLACIMLPTFRTKRITISCKPNLKTCYRLSRIKTRKISQFYGTPSVTKVLKNIGCVIEYVLYCVINGLKIAHIWFIVSLYLVIYMCHLKFDMLLQSEIYRLQLSICLIFRQIFEKGPTRA